MAMSRAVRLDALRALSEQQGLLERLFPKDVSDYKGNARALLVLTTRAIKSLLHSTEGLEEEALGMRRHMAREHAVARDDLKRAYRNAVLRLRGAHAVALATLTTDLEVAEVVDKVECERVRARLTSALEQERDAKTRIAEKAAAQAAGHDVTLRELTDALDKNRNSLHEELDAVRLQLRESEEARRQLVEEMRKSEEAHAIEMGHLNHERATVASALRDEIARADGLAELLNDLQKSHRSACAQATMLQHRVEAAEEHTAHTHEILSQRMSNMHRLQQWALAATSAKALERKGVRELAMGERAARRALEASAASRAAASSQGLLSGAGAAAAWSEGDRDDYKELWTPGGRDEPRDEYFPRDANTPLTTLSRASSAAALSSRASSAAALARPSSVSGLASASSLGGVGTPRSPPWALASSSHASRSRGMLYSEMTRMRLEAGAM